MIFDRGKGQGSGHVALCSLGAAVLLLAGCQPAPIVADDLLPAPVQITKGLPAYADLVAQYNRKVAGLERLSARSSVKFHWRDEKGKEKKEHGDGFLLFVRPHRLALKIEKFGVGTLFWLGSDSERYWLFDLVEDSTVWVGRRGHAIKPSEQGPPLPVHPGTVPYLLGLLPLEPPEGPGPAVEALWGYYLIEPPGLNLRLLLEPGTGRPVRVDLTDADGHSVLICRLSDYKPVQIENVPRDQWPQVAGQAELVAVGTEASMTLKLSSPSDGSRGKKIRDEHFDFDVLCQVHGPKQIIHLDAESE